MQKVLNFLKNVYTFIKNWVVSNGVEGVLGLLLGLLLWTMGHKVYAGFAFGVFATRNWDLVKNWIAKFVK